MDFSFMPGDTLPFLTFTALSVILARVGSAWIETLYLAEPEILSYPNTALNPPTWRMYLLTFGVLLLYFFSADDPTLVFMAKFVLVYFLLLFSTTDFEQQVIFDRMLLPFGLLALFFGLALDLSLLPSIVAALLGGLLFLILAVVTGGGIGGGDIKLIFTLGLWFGFPGLKIIIIMGCILGGIVALIAMLATKKKRGEYLAYGPYFCLAAIYLCLTK